MSRFTFAAAVSLITILALPLPSQARWTKPEEADVEIDSKTEYEISSDGHSKMRETSRVKILNENGRNNWGTLRFGYRPKNSDLKVLRASVRTNDHEIKVKGDNIVDQAIRGSEVGFDDVRQVMVAFPQVQVGSELSFETQEKIFRPFVENQSAHRLVFGTSGLEKSAEYTVVSERPLYTHINDPDQVLEVKSEKIGSKHKLWIRLKKPVLRRIFDEQRSYVSDLDLPWVLFSTAATHGEMYSDMARSYEKRLQEPLPERFQGLLEQGKAESEPVQKINRVLAGLASLVRYMGDWRAVDGGFIPRRLEQIAETQSGDCKDMSTLTVKVLRELGFEAWVALVWRGPAADSIVEVPGMSFNHAIVHVRLKDRDLWLDPTNFHAFAQGVLYDIAERKAMVLNTAKVELKEIHFSPAAQNEETVSAKSRFVSAGRIHGVIGLNHKGILALSETGALLRISRAQFEEAALNNLTNRSEVVSYKMETSDLNSRIVQPSFIRLNLEREFTPRETSTGPALPFLAAELITELSHLDIPKRDSGYYLGPPSVYKTSQVIENLVPQGQGLKNCRVDSPWVSYSFTFQRSPLKVDHKVEIKQHVMTRADLRSEKFTAFQKALKACGREKFLVYALAKGKSA